MRVTSKSSSAVRHFGEQGTSLNLAICLAAACGELITTSPWKDRARAFILTLVVEDAIIYVASGKGLLLTSPKDEESDPERHELTQGDFVFIPAWTEHQALNEAEGDMVWVIIRSGSQPVEVSLTDWGGPQMKSKTKR